MSFCILFSSVLCLKSYVALALARNALEVRASKHLKLIWGTELTGTSDVECRLSRSSPVNILNERQVECYQVMKLDLLVFECACERAHASECSTDPCAEGEPNPSLVRENFESVHSRQSPLKAESHPHPSSQSQMQPLAKDSSPADFASK